MAYDLSFKLTAEKYVFRIF